MSVLFTCLCLLLKYSISASKSDSIHLQLTVKNDKVYQSIPKMFFGFTMDWWKPTDHQYGKKWGNASILYQDLSNPILINLTKALTPAILRLGGSPEDSIVYNISGMCLKTDSEQYGCGQSGKNYGCLSESRWLEILEFMDETQLSLVFGLNACFGRPNRSALMDYTNIDQLFNVTLDYYNSGRVKSPIYGFELGNEISWSIDGDIYARDFANIHSMIKEKWTDYGMEKEMVPFMIGPDAEQRSSAWQWNLEILNTLNDISYGNVPSIQRALTYHHYPNCNSPNGNVSVFSMDCLSSIGFMARNYTSKLADAYGVEVWMGEGSEHSGGGVLGLTNVFASSFYYIYHLCEVAKYGVKGTIRSDLVGGYYELINHTTTEPTPDYWMLYLWRMYIGESMFDSSLNVSAETNVRGYAFAHRDDGFVMVLINFNLWNSAVVDLKVENGEYQFDEYHVIGVGNDGLKTKRIQVNEVVLQYKDGVFPDWKAISGDGAVTVEPRSIVFVHAHS